VSWLLDQLRAKASQGDLAGVWSLVSRTATDSFYEWRLGVSTARARGTTELGFSNTEFHCYEATDYQTLKAIMRRVRVRAGEDVFLDFGAGKGRALVVAAMRPFKRVIGVEISRELAALATANLERARRHLVCRDVQVICADATTVQIPDDTTVIFLFNPFHGDVLVQVLLNVRASVGRRPRHLRFVLVNPRHVDEAVRSAMQGWLNPSEEFTAPGGEFRTVLYETTHP